MSDSQISPTEVFGSALEQIKKISQVGGTEDSQIEPVVFTPKDEVSSDSFKHKKRAIVLSEDALKLYAQGLLYVTEERSFYECASDGIYASIRDDHLRDKLKQKYRLISNSYDFEGPLHGSRSCFISRMTKCAKERFALNPLITKIKLN